VSAHSFEKFNALSFISFQLSAIRFFYVLSVYRWLFFLPLSFHLAYLLWNKKFDKPSIFTRLANHLFLLFFKYILLQCIYKPPR
jgi:hypothetical protein